jgi:hypothetical protein
MRETKDELSALFRSAGHTSPAVDLTDRIMARVAVTPLLRPTSVKPLLGRAAWIGIILVTAAVLLAGSMGSVTTGTASSAVRDAWRTIGPSLPAVGNWALWLSGLSASLLVLAAVDRLLAGRHRSI